MKRIVVLQIFLSLCAGIKAQTFEEWFRQKDTQKKYLLQQIAAFQVYLGYVRKGYSIVQKGSATISTIKSGEFHLNADYFNSFTSVNPEIKKYAKVAAIITKQFEIMEVYKRAYKGIIKSDAINRNEMNYIGGVFKKLLNDCSGIIDDLTIVTTSDKLGMKDDERLERIDALYDDIQSKYSFIQSFSKEALALAGTKTQEKNDYQTSRAILGIK